MKKILFSLLLYLVYMGCAGSGSFEQSSHDTYKEIELAIKLDPKNADLYVDLGKLHRENSDYENAIKNYNTALNLHPGYNPALVEKGYVFWAQEKYRDALDCFNTVLYSYQAKQYADSIAAFIGLPFEIKQVSDGIGNNAFPSCSPGGDKLLFQSNRSGNWEIYWMDLASRKVKQLTKNGARNETPVFHKDGETFAYTSTVDDTVNIRIEDMVRDIYMGNIYNFKPLRVTHNLVDDWNPMFSKYQDILYYTSREKVNDMDESNSVHAYQLATQQSNKVWQDSISLSLGDMVCENTFYYSKKNPNKFNIYHKDMLTGTEQKIPATDGDNVGARVFNNGSKMVFFAKVDQNYDIYIKDLTSGTVKKLTCSPDIDAFPDVTSNGKIYFHSNRNGSYQIYQIDPAKRASVDNVRKTLRKVVLNIEKKKIESGS